MCAHAAAVRRKKKRTGHDIGTLQTNKQEQKEQTTKRTKDRRGSSRRATHILFTDSMSLMQKVKSTIGSPERYVSFFVSSSLNLWGGGQWCLIATSWGSQRRSPLSSWRLRPFKLHYLHGWWSHLADGQALTTHYSCCGTCSWLILQPSVSLNSFDEILRAGVPDGVSWTAHCWSKKNWHVSCSVFLDCPLLTQEKLTHFVFCFHGLPTVEVRKADTFRVLFSWNVHRWSKKSWQDLPSVPTVGGTFHVCVCLFGGRGNAWARVVVLCLPPSECCLRNQKYVLSILF